MQLVFERGSAQRPKGHALVYFRDSGSDAILATYLVIAPITIDIAKYLPPMLAGQGLAGLGQATSIIPLPPIPEPVASFALLETLSEQREDDLIFAGAVQAGAIEGLLQQTSEAGQLYMHMYEDYARGFVLPGAGSEVEPESLAEGSGPSADELSYALMGERERLGELARLAGTLRYALDGADRQLASETSEKMRLLAKHLAPKFWPDRVVDIANTPGDAAGRLSQLYIDRCYKLVDEDYAAVGAIERQIQEMQPPA